MLLALNLLLGLWACGQDIDADGDGAPASADCDDANPNIHPEAVELCDGVDNDCDGLVDDADDSVSEAALETWYADADGDGWGVGAILTQACDAPADAASQTGDCDDASPEVYPAAPEVCDGIDNDCDGLADDADTSLDPSGTTLWYVDADGDGYGDEDDRGALYCQAPSGWSEVATDCDDGDREVNPGAEEICDDGVDNDCSGEAPECAFLGAFSVSDAGLSLVVSTPQETLGRSVLAADFNGSGRPALAIGVPGSDALATNGGSVLILDRGLSPGGSPGAISQIASISAEGYVGTDVAVAGDVDGDGLQDLLIGNAASSRTSFVVLFPANADGAFVSGATFFRGSGDSASPDSFGSEVAYVGDLNQDGFDDVAIGASTHGEGGDSGAVHFWESWGSSNYTSSTSAAVIGQEGDHLGQRDTVLSADFDGDGDADVITGAPRQARMYLNHGPFSGERWAVDSDSVIQGGASEDDLGQSPVSADLNDDGYLDLAVGAPGQLDSDGQSVGATHIFLGEATGWGAALDSADSDIQLFGDASQDNSGSAHVVADVDGDGQLDLLVGQSGWGSDAGAAYLFLGPLAEGPAVTADADASFQGAGGGACGGLGTLGVEDLDVDGRVDVFMGCPLEGDAQQGAVHIFFGQLE